MPSLASSGTVLKPKEAVRGLDEDGGSWVCTDRKPRVIRRRHVMGCWGRLLSTYIVRWGFGTERMVIGASRLGHVKIIRAIIQVPFYSYFLTFIMVVTLVKSVSKGPKGKEKAMGIALINFASIFTDHFIPKFRLRGRVRFQRC
jgi:hypothetical protein